MIRQSRSVKELRDRIGVGAGVAEELLVLSGGDVDMAEDASKKSRGLDQCKASIINSRFENIERRLDQCERDAT